MVARREQMVTTSQFLSSTRNLGIKISEGVCEIIDNSFDAGSSKINIHIENNKAGTLRITFTDNGVGIPAIHVDKNGDSHQGIPYVLTYGGRIPHPHFENPPVGKFGWGLSATASCLSSRTEVYSKTASDKNWRYSYYDFVELENDPEILLPLEQEANPPYFELPETGTIICMKEVDTSEYKSPFAIHNMLVGNLGRIYRYFIQHSREITISSRENNKPKETKIQISDPMMLMEESKEVQSFGKSIIEEEHEIIFDDKHPLGPIYETDGEFAKISSTFTRLDAQTLRKKLNLPLTGTMGKNMILKTKAGVSNEKSGYSLIRNGREIGGSQTLGLFQRADSLNYFRAEIRFSEALDELFKIRTNKSRYNLDINLKDLFKEQYDPIMNRIQIEHRSIQKSMKSQKQDYEIPSAEIIVAKSSANIIKKRITETERNHMIESINQEVNYIKENLIKQNQEEISEIKTNIENAKKSKDIKLVEKYNDEIQKITEQHNSKIMRIDERFELNSVIRKEFSEIGTGELFGVESRGDQAWIYINTGTSFYNNVYKRLDSNPDLQTLLDLMIFSMGYAEHTQDTSLEKKSQWENARREVSTLASQMVGSMAINLIDADEGGEN